MRALAIINCFNESDILGHVLDHLLSQGIDIHICDNWSTDGSYQIALRKAMLWPERVRVERFPYLPSEQTSWRSMLRHTEELAAASGYDWILHHDADEIRRSQVEGELLIDAIARLDVQGCTVIDHDVHTYEMLEEYDSSQDPEVCFRVRVITDTGYGPGQEKCWKQPPGRKVDINTMGGHRILQYPAKRVAPERLLMKHYPLRSIQQARDKLDSRKSRWVADERRIGWHGHYDGVVVPSKAPAILTLTRFPEIFQSLADSIAQHESQARALVVTSGGTKIKQPCWQAIKGKEPFIFARNANLAMEAVGDRDVLLINDDCRLAMPLLAYMQKMCDEDQTIGLLSPQIVGHVGNPIQKGLPPDPRIDWLCFVCIYIPWRTREKVGLMDERFTGYGGDDVDYSHRVRAAGLRLAIADDLRVLHGFGKAACSSSFARTMGMEERNRSMAEMNLLVREKEAGVK